MQSELDPKLNPPTIDIDQQMLSEQIDQQKSKLSKKKYLLFGIFFLLIFLVSGAFGYFLYNFLDDSSSPNQIDENSMVAINNQEVANNTTAELSYETDKGEKIAGTIKRINENYSTYTSYEKDLTFSFPNNWKVCTDAYNNSVELEPIIENSENSICDNLRKYSNLYVSLDNKPGKKKNELKDNISKEIQADLDYRNNYINTYWKDTEVNNEVQEYSIQDLSGFIRYEITTHGPTLKSYYLFTKDESQLLTIKGAMEAKEYDVEDAIKMILNSAKVQSSQSASMKKYTNQSFGFSMMIPNEATYTSACRSSKYENRTIETYESDSVVYIAPSSVLVKSTANPAEEYTCTKQTTTLDLLENNPELISDYYYKIVIADVSNDVELEKFIKQKFGSSCSLGGKNAVTKDLFNVSITVPRTSDGFDINCIVNYAYNIKYSPTLERVFSWHAGQEPLFQFADLSTGQFTESFDQKMSDSFEVLP